MKELRLETGPAQDKYVRGNLLFVRIEFSDSEMAVMIGPDSHMNLRDITELNSHTVWELEHLAMGLRYVALNRSPKRFRVRSRDCLIGPSLGLDLALRIYLGGTLFYCSIRSPSQAGRSVVDIEAIFSGRAECAPFEVNEVIAFAEQIYDQAKLLASRYVSYGEPDFPV